LVFSFSSEKTIKQVALHPSDDGLRLMERWHQCEAASQASTQTHTGKNKKSRKNKKT